MPKEMTPSRLKLEIASENDPSFRWVAIALLVLAELMLYTPSLVHGLVADDFAIREFHNRPLLSLWSQPTDLHGHWRPLSYSFKHVFFSLFSEAAFPWHAINVLVHLASVLVFFQILLNLSESSERKGMIGPLIAAIVFQIHPAAVQNVYWVSGFSDLLYVLFLLLATRYSLVSMENRKSHFMVWTMVFFTAALFSKEAAIIFPVFLAFLFRLTIGSWQSVLKLDGRMIGALSFVSVLFGMAFLSGSGSLLMKQPGPVTGALGVFARGFGMLVIPTDAMMIYQVGTESPLVAAGVGALVVLAIVLILRKKLLNVKMFALFCLVFLAGFSVYVVGGYISLRLMYGSVCFFIMSMFVALTRRPWWTLPDIFTRILRWSVAVYVLLVLFFSFSAALDWHVADKFAKALRASFVDFHLEAQEKQYVFGAIPSRLRQAEIVGGPDADFRGELRQSEISDSVDLRSLLRIVLLDRDDVSSNVLMIRSSENSLILSTQTEHQFFLLGRDIRLRLPVGTRFEDGGYTIEVLETILDSRAATVRVTARDSADLNRLLFFDDQESQFLHLQEIEALSRDESDE